ncbi:MAG: single-stranded-DNA-specific exonuclease RecJ [Candidatus Omnitrophica bacterium]|nr:single-stranded-DNA-specific exonuclease RecJ [Candidatus Omnitrophota bacterium]
MTTVWELAQTSVPGTTVPGSQNSAPAVPGTVTAYTALMQKLLALRGFHRDSDIQQFLFPSLDLLHNPLLMKGISRSSKRILSAIERGEVILIHGDYDVDGITGTALLSRTFKKLNANFFTFLPVRKRDGYGVSREAIRLAAMRKASLFITVDCGITAFDEAREATEAGMDVIVIDHHRIHGGEMPAAFEVINPLQADCTYPFKELSACGLAFKLAQALLGPGAYELLDLVALSCVCDIAPLVDENRILVTFGLEKIGARSQVGFKALCESAGLRRRKLSATDLGFILGPRINASGRMSSPDTALALLTTNDSAEAETLAQALEGENKARQQEDRRLLKQALQAVEQEINFARDRVIVVAGEGWHEGVIGIVAQRLVEYFRRPSVVIAFDGERGKGSGRSVKGFHLFKGLEHCQDLLEEFGGHELAAGLAIQRGNFEAFRKRINEFGKTVSPDVFLKSIRIDLEISLQDLSAQFLREISLLEPFGAGNPRPVFLTHGVRTKRRPERLGSNGFKWWLGDEAMTFEAVWRSRGSSVSFPESEPYSIVYTPTLKSWEGIDSVVLEIRDIKTEC